MSKLSKSYLKCTSTMNVIKISDIAVIYERNWLGYHALCLPVRIPQV